MVADTPANMRRWYEIVDELTTRTGLVTSEIVPARRAGNRRGGDAVAPPPAPGYP
ncbi:MAG: hypothetical protein H0V42_05820 [Nocardioidaceae bacterium]|nr:hypothetical protein [Nocardioidaceae bacterium]